MLNSNYWADLWQSFIFALLQVLYLQQAEVTRERVYAMHQSSIDGVEDMSALAELHEAAIMHNLYQRYQKDSIYVSAFRESCMSWPFFEVYVCIFMSYFLSSFLSTQKILVWRPKIVVRLVLKTMKWNDLIQRNIKMGW